LIPNKSILPPKLRKASRWPRIKRYRRDKINTKIRKDSRKISVGKGKERAIIEVSNDRSSTSGDSSDFDEEFDTAFRNKYGLQPAVPEVSLIRPPAKRRATTNTLLSREKRLATTSTEETAEETSEETTEETAEETTEETAEETTEEPTTRRSRRSGRGRAPTRYGIL
jgi:hypothetical protein